METTTTTRTHSAGGDVEAPASTLRRKPKRKKKRAYKARVAPNPSVVKSFGLEKIQVLFDAGMTAEAVAQQIGVCRGTLYPALRRHWGVKPQRVAVLVPVHPGVSWPDTTQCGPTTLGELRAMLAHGVRISLILKELGCDRHDLAYPLKGLGYALQERTRLVAAGGK